MLFLETGPRLPNLTPAFPSSPPEGGERIYERLCVGQLGGESVPCGESFRASKAGPCFCAHERPPLIGKGARPLPGGTKIDRAGALFVGVVACVFVPCGWGPMCY